MPVINFGDKLPEDESKGRLYHISVTPLNYKGKAVSSFGIRAMSKRKAGDLAKRYVARYNRLHKRPLVITGIRGA